MKDKKKKLQCPPVLNSPFIDTQTIKMYSNVIIDASAEMIIDEVVCLGASAKTLKVNNYNFFS